MLSYTEAAPHVSTARWTAPHWLHGLARLWAGERSSSYSSSSRSGPVVQAQLCSVLMAPW